ncbi:response regulator [Pseudomonas auratipiscis]|uniref:Response regulator n=1 Tax=Pseudomonas auratipiscis TaxID=3115853 RepID=A0AB35WLA4_9PSED|nr:MULTISPECIES: response regulator [unclassified Pseudomonas]MEE1864967.1 response regulator [Pseudomonas sp. 120P]MEE1956092.1 response regulator [Pseudomonas sp. 119P]
MAKVLIVDPYPLSRLGSETLLNQAGHSVVAFADNGLDALNLARTAVPDLVVLDLDIPRLGGLDVIKRIAARKSSTIILVLTALPADVYEHLCIAAGASGFVSKSDTLESFADAVNKVLAGKTCFHASALRHDPAPATPTEQLTAREVTVLHYLADGYRVKQIAGELAISDRTVSTYKTRLLEKTGTHSLVELLHVATQRGFLEGRADSDKAGVDSDQASALQFNALLDQIPFPVCLRAADARILAANQAFLDYLGLTRNAVLDAKQCDIGVIDIEHLEFARETFNTAVAKQIPYMMVIAVRLHGERRVLKHSGCPVIDQGGGLVGMLCTSIDIGEEQAQIEALREQLAYLTFVRDRRSTYLIEHADSLDRYLCSARAVVDGNDRLNALFERMHESVQWLREMVHLETGQNKLSPFSHNLNALTRNTLQHLPSDDMPAHDFTSAKSNPWGWIDPTAYASLIKALFLHLMHRGAALVSIRADAYEKDAGYIEWHLCLTASMTSAESMTAPVIYLCVASELSTLFEADLQISSDDEQAFEAHLRLTIPLATAAH